MVCLRCKAIVRQELIRLNLHPININIGPAEIVETLSPNQKEELNAALLNFGLELVEDRKSMLVEKIKRAIHEFVYDQDEPLRVNFSCHLNKQLKYDYTYLANVFSQAEGVTIEHYMILQKIERVKNLLFIEDLSLKEIAYKLSYSSTAHLSYQFKKVTGYTTSCFKEQQKRDMMATFSEYHGNAVLVL